MIYESGRQSAKQNPGTGRNGEINANILSLVIDGDLKVHETNKRNFKLFLKVSPKYLQQRPNSTKNHFTLQS